MTVTGRVMTDFGFFTSCRRERRGQASASASLKICVNGLLNRQSREYKSLCMISSSSVKSYDIDLFNRQKKKTTFFINRIV